MGRPRAFSTPPLNPDSGILPSFFGGGRDTDSLKLLDFHPQILRKTQIYGGYFDKRVAGLGIQQVLTAPRSPWQNPYVERIIGSIRRECLDHTIILNEQHLRRILKTTTRPFAPTARASSIFSCGRAGSSTCARSICPSSFLEGSGRHRS